MKQFSLKLYQFSRKTALLLSAGLLLFLFVCGFFYTCYAQDMTSQLVLTKRDPILLNLAGLLTGLLLSALLVRLCSHGKKRNTILLCFVLFVYVTAGLILVVFSKTVPAADSMSVYAAASELAAGNTGVIHPSDSYLSYYPQQMGLVAYFELVIRLWNLLPFDLPAYHILKCINILWACVIVFFQYRITEELFHNASVNTLYLVLALCNAPLILYTSFVYGEVPSFALFCAGLWAAVRLLHARSLSWQYALAGLLCFTGSVALRKNTLILMIAVIIVLLFESLRLHRPSLTVLAGIYLLASLSILPLITSLYEQRAGDRLSSGVPAMSYFAMGMQESSRAEGWYNGFNFNTFQETGMDTELTNALSRKAIQERMQEFAAHPDHCVQFYFNKLRSQWCDGTLASRQATLATFGGRTPFFQELYEGRFSPFFIGFCNQYQNLLYLGALLFCLVYNRFSDKKKQAESSSALPVQPEHDLPALYPYVGLIGVIGGFLFHLIWEANARYILPYSLLLLPYAAWGLGFLLSRCRLKHRSLI